MSTTPRRRNTLMGVTAFITAGALSFLGLSVPAYAATGDNSQALAQFLGTDLLASQLLNVGTAESSSPGGPASDTNPLNLAALQALGLELQVIGDGLEVPLITAGSTPGLLTLGQLGVVQNYASSTPTGSVAASGLIGNDGTIAVSQNATPTDFGNATVNLTSLLGQLGLAGATGPIVDSLGLEVGALASHIEMTAAGTPVSEYRVTDLKANLHSALVAALATQLRAAGVAVGTSVSGGLNGLVGTGGVLTDVVDAVPAINVLGLADVTLGEPTIAVTLPNLGAVVDTVLGTNAILISDNQAVTINLTTGTVSIDLAKIVNPGGPNLNGLPANTRVLTTGTIPMITAGVTNAIGKLAAPLTAALQTAVRTTSVTISLQVTATLLPILGPTGKLIDAPITISGTLQQLATGAGNIDTSGLVLLPSIPLCIGAIVLGSCVGIDLNGLVGALVSTVVTSVVTPLLVALGPAVLGILTATDADITTGLNGVLTGLVTSLNFVLDGVLANIVDITINEQSQPGDLGAGSATVRALSLTLLPRVLGSALAKVSLASSTVLAAPAPTVNIVEPSIREGGTITVNGANWDPASSVSVAFVDSSGAAVGSPEVITPAADGTFSFTRVIPVGTPGPVTATATQGGFAPTDSVVVTVTPAVNILETSVLPGDDINVVGQGWDSATPVTLVYTDGTGDPIGAPATVSVNPDGTFATTFTVPLGTVGPITATATQGADTADDTVAVAAVGDAALNIVEITVVEGGTVSVNGTNWTPLAPLAIGYTDNAGVPIGAETVTTLADGSFATTFLVPVGTVGPVTATGTQLAVVKSDTVLVTSAPNVNIVESTIVEGGTVTVNGTNWTPLAPVTINYTDNAGLPIGTETVTTLADGSFATTFVVPVGTVGPVTATAVQGAVTDSDTVAVTAVVVPPAVDIVETTVVAGNPITLNGVGWNAALPVTLAFADGNGAVVAGGFQVSPLANGTFATTFTVPVGTVGPLTATATQGGNSKFDTVAVTAAPAVNIVETTIVEGGTVTVNGTNWTPLAPVTINYTDNAGLPIGTETRTTLADGSFATTFVVPVGTVGPVTATAVQGAATDSDTVAVTAAVVPTPASVDIVETTIVAGGTVTVNGADWTPFVSVAITYTDNAGLTVGTATVTPIADGSFAATFVVPVGTVGPVTTTAVQGAVTDSDTVAVTAAVAVTPTPTVNIVENEVAPGDVIHIVGDDWVPNSTVTIVITDGNGGVLDTLPSVPTDGTGSFDVDWTVPAGAVGPITVTATQGANVASDSVNITAATTTGPAVTKAAASKLAYTGFEGMWLAGLAALLLLTGAGAVGVTRARKSRVN